MKLVVTFDGPVASGKSSLARRVARQVGYIFLSTGLLYRAVAYRVRDLNLERKAEDETYMFGIAMNSSYSFSVVDHESRLFLNGFDVTDELKKDDISMLASQISKHQRVRKALLRIQQGMGKNGGIVAEGRDTGRVVFPHADIKYWLTADIDFRARMRQRDLLKDGKTISFRDIYKQVVARDKQDMEGETPSLVRTSDMIELDTTNKDLDDLAFEVSENILGREKELCGY